MRQKRDNIVYLEDIVEYAHRIFSYLKTHTYDEYVKNEWDQAAVARNLEIVCEAASRIDKEFQEAHPEIEWKKIIGTRNVIVHDYPDIDIDIIWDIISYDLPALVDRVNTTLKQIRP